MKKYINLLRYFLLLIAIVLIIFEVFIRQHGSINSQIAKKLEHYDTKFEELLHMELIDDKKLLAFYRSGENEFSYGILQDNALGLRVIRGSGSISMVSDKNLTWMASGGPNGTVGLVYGALINPDITQVVVISEGNKPARIIEKSNTRFWYLPIKNDVSMPVTIQATDKNGTVLYECGDLEFWSGGGKD